MGVRRAGVTRTGALVAVVPEDPAARVQAWRDKHEAEEFSLHGQALRLRPFTTRPGRFYIVFRGASIASP